MSAEKKARATPPSVPRSRLAVGLCLLATIGLTAADLASKAWAEGALAIERTNDAPPLCEPGTMQRLRAEPVVLIEGYLELRYAENCGAAFGLMRGASPNARKAVFGIAATLASIALLVMFVRGRGRVLFAYSVPLIVSGAVGNLVDRIRYGYVVDFIYFHWQDAWEYPTFNVADCGITVGVVLLVLDGFREGKAERAPVAQDGA